MLVLSRKSQEAVVVESLKNNGSVLRITVIDILGQRVRLGFEATDDVTIQRSELWDQMHLGRSPQNNSDVDDINNSAAEDRWDDDGGNGPARIDERRWRGTILFFANCILKKGGKYV